MENRRKNIIIVVSLLIMALSLVSFSLPLTANALTEKIFISIKINGQLIGMDTLPYVKNDRTFVPVRFVSEALNATVAWDSEEKKVTISQDDKTIEMWLDSNRIITNGQEQLMDVSVECLDNRIMIPVKFITEALGATVEWDGLTYTALIKKEDAVVPVASILNRSYSDEDIIWLARIIHVEAGSVSLDGKVAIANSVLNRKDSVLFPNSVFDVIFDKAYCTQFPPAHKPSFKELIPPSDCVIAAKMALEGINIVDKCMYFNNRPFSSSARVFYTKIDGIYFYR